MTRQWSGTGRGWPQQRLSFPSQIVPTCDVGFICECVGANVCECMCVLRGMPRQGGGGKKVCVWPSVEGVTTGGQVGVVGLAGRCLHLLRKDRMGERGEYCLFSPLSYSHVRHVTDVNVFCVFPFLRLFYMCFSRFFRLISLYPLSFLYYFSCFRESSLLLLNHSINFHISFYSFSFLFFSFIYLFVFSHFFFFPLFFIHICGCWGQCVFLFSFSS